MENSHCRTGRGIKSVVKYRSAKLNWTSYGIGSGIPAAHPHSKKTPKLPPAPPTTPSGFQWVRTKLYEPMPAVKCQFCKTHFNCGPFERKLHFPKKTSNNRMILINITLHSGYYSRVTFVSCKQITSASRESKTSFNDLSLRAARIPLIFHVKILISFQSSE